MKENSRPYSSKIIKAGALLTDSKSFLQAYDEKLSAVENLQRLQRENIFAKDTRSRVADILPIFRQRFCDDQALARPLRKLARGSTSPDVLDRILYFHAGRSDRLLYDFACNFLFEKQRTGDLQVKFDDASRFVSALLQQHGVSWSPSTLQHATQGLLATLRDFHVLEGAVKKRIAPIYLPPEAFAYIAFAIHVGGPSGDRLVHHPDWRLFLLTPQAVERLFLEAHQRHLLSYQAAGNMIRIEFITRTLEEMADVIAARAH
ncbi:MAG: DUF1819 family protein [Deinococcus sp.]|nr:DUF1819 family protein [Deinococcus sp.]